VPATTLTKPFNAPELARFVHYLFDSRQVAVARLVDACGIALWTVGFVSMAVFALVLVAAVPSIGLAFSAHEFADTLALALVAVAGVASGNWMLRFAEFGDSRHRVPRTSTATFGSLPDEVLVLSVVADVSGDERAAGDDLEALRAHVV
jgi:hypothetical protein